MHFVIRWTMLRGVLDVPELLDENGQVLARVRMEQDEAATRGAQSMWDREASMPRRERRTAAAANLAWAKRIISRAEGC